MNYHYFLKNTIKDTVCSEPGVYRLFTKEKSNLNLVYIGKSINLRIRLMEHRRTLYMKFDCFDFDYYYRGILDQVERMELDKFWKINGCWPKYNNQGGNGQRPKINR